MDEGGLWRRLTPGDFCKIYITLYLLFCGGFEIKFFKAVTVEHHHPRLLRVGGIDKHAFCHSGITPRRADAAERKTAGSAVLCTTKTPAPEAVPRSND